MVTLRENGDALPKSFRENGGKMVTLYRSLLATLPCAENRTAISGEKWWGKMVTLGEKGEKW